MIYDCSTETRFQPQTSESFTFQTRFPIVIGFIGVTPLLDFDFGIFAFAAPA